MEDLVDRDRNAFPDPAFWKGKRVLLTGHTGFKGGWLAAWLVHLGARVTGLALPPSVANSLYERAQLGRKLQSNICDVRDRESVANIVTACKPEIIIHMAAQAIVSHSYRDPVFTYETNVMGTVNVLEAARGCDSVRAIVVITSDKCYENREWEWPYRESDHLGGHDPYSSSKACAELAIAAWRRSFFHEPNAAGVASTRAGNVIGGGDWSPDRLVPDCIRAFIANKPVRVRHPNAIRPWQYVLEPLRGYLVIAERLYVAPHEFSQSWNFGPKQDDARPVIWLVQRAAALWEEGARWEMTRSDHPHEATFLQLDVSRAATKLEWRPRVDLLHALEWTIAWYRGVCRGEDAAALTDAHITAYEKLFWS